MSASEFLGWTEHLKYADHIDIALARIAYEIYIFRVSFVGLAPGETAKAFKDFVCRELPEIEKEDDGRSEAERMDEARQKRVDTDKAFWGAVLAAGANVGNK